MRHNPSKRRYSDLMNEIERIPLKLKGVCKSAVWGGDKLSSEWGKHTNENNIAESWELTVRPNEKSVIVGGDFDGMTLEDWLDLAGDDAVAPRYRKGKRFPVLVKLIDAGGRLSIQVHPDDEDAAKLEADLGETGKNELWYIVSAAPGASIVYGLCDGADADTVINALADGRGEQFLQKRSVRAGECYFIPAGTVHALGENILIAEIQQNSDLTYRLYDYGRRTADGTLRPLHTEKARAVIRNRTEAEIEAIRYAGGDKDRADVLAHCPYFRVSKWEIGETSCRKEVGESFSFLMCIEGNGFLQYGKKEYPIVRGDSYFLPHGMNSYECVGKMTLLCTELA